MISFKEQSYMLHPSFKDDVILFTARRNRKFAFMIEESQSNSFHPKSLKELTAYFENKERRNIEERQQEKDSYCNSKKLGKKK